MNWYKMFLIVLTKDTEGMTRIIFIVSFLIPFSLLGQADLVSEKPLSEVWVMPQFSQYFNLSSSLDDFQKLAPESVILNSDLSEYENQNFGTSSGSSSGFSVLLGFKLKDSSGEFNNRRILRVGFSYGYNQSLYYNLTKSDRTTIDTLVSIQTGEEFYIDSVSSETISMDYSSHVFMLDASLVFKTDADARWSLYGGVGISLGLNLNPRVDVYYNNFEAFESPQNNPSNIISGTFSSEQFSTKSGIMAGVYLPGGVDFRLGDRPFWYRTHLIYELRPSLLVSDIPELKTYAQLGFVQSFALRVVW